MTMTTTIGELGTALERLRFFMRLSCELRLIDTRRYEHAARCIDDIGRMVGGWVKAHHARTA